MSRGRWCAVGRAACGVNRLKPRRARHSPTHFKGQLLGGGVVGQVLGAWLAPGRWQFDLGLNQG